MRHLIWPGLILAGILLGVVGMLVFQPPGPLAAGLDALQKASLAQVKAEQRAYAAAMDLRAQQVEMQVAIVRKAREESVSAIAAVGESEIAVMQAVPAPELRERSGESLHACQSYVEALETSANATRIHVHRLSAAVQSLQAENMQLENLALMERQRFEVSSQRVEQLHARERWKLRWGVGATAGGIRAFDGGWSPGVALGLSVVWGR